MGEKDRKYSKITRHDLEVIQFGLRKNRKPESNKGNHLGQNPKENVVFSGKNEALLAKIEEEQFGCILEELNFSGLLDCVNQGITRYTKQQKKNDTSTFLIPEILIAISRNKGKQLVDINSRAQVIVRWDERTFPAGINRGSIVSSRKLQILPYKESDRIQINHSKSKAIWNDPALVYSDELYGKVFENLITDQCQPTFDSYGLINGREYPADWNRNLAYRPRQVQKSHEKFVFS